MIPWRSPSKTSARYITASSKRKPPAANAAGGLTFSGSKTEVALCVVEADAFHDLLEGGIDVGVLTVFYPVTDEVAHNATEIVVTGVTQEGAGVGKHADEITQQAQTCQGLHLLFHANLVIVEPPGRTVLDLAGNLGALEAADECAQLGIVSRIQRVQDGLGALTGLFQSGQKLGDVATAGVLGNGIHTGVTALELEDPLVVVA